MPTKLTLNIDKNVIVSAKRYALIHKQSVSKIVENYLRDISSITDENFGLPPITKKLAGILKNKPEINYKSDYSDFLNEKYK